MPLVESSRPYIPGRGHAPPTMARGRWWHEHPLWRTRATGVPVHVSGVPFVRARRVIWGPSWKGISSSVLTAFPSSFTHRRTHTTGPTHTRRGSLSLSAPLLNGRAQKVLLAHMVESDVSHDPPTLFSRTIGTTSPAGFRQLVSDDRRPRGDPRDLSRRVPTWESSRPDESGSGDRWSASEWS